MLTVTYVNGEMMVQWGEPDMVYQVVDNYGLPPYTRKFHFVKSIDPNSPLWDAVVTKIVHADKDEVVNRWVIEEPYNGPYPPGVPMVPEPATPDERAAAEVPLTPKELAKLTKLAKDAPGT